MLVHVLTFIRDFERATGKLISDKKTKKELGYSFDYTGQEFLCVLQEGMKEEEEKQLRARLWYTLPSSN